MTRQPLPLPPALLLCCCHWRVRPNALHITFWSFYDLSISLIVAVAHPSARLVLLAWVTISLSQGLATRWHNTLNRISYWRALKSQIIHGGSSTIVLTVAFCSKDNRHREGDSHREFLAIVCQLSHCMWCESFCSAICGRVAHITCLVALVDVLTKSCQSLKQTFYFFYLHSALLPPLPPTVLLLLLLAPPPLLPRLEAAEEEEEATAAEAACVEDVVAQSSEDFSAKKKKKKQTNKYINCQAAQICTLSATRFAICHGGTTVQQHTSNNNK